MDFIFVVFFDIWPIILAIVVLLIIGLYMSVDLTKFGTNWLESNQETISYIGMAIFFLIVLVLAVKLGKEFKNDGKKCSFINTIFRIIAYTPIAILGGYLSFGVTVNITAHMLGTMDDVISFLLLIIPIILCFLLLLIIMFVFILLFVVLPVGIMQSIEDNLLEKAKNNFQSVLYTIISNFIPLIILFGILLLIVYFVQ
jgi:hypothetical protein